MLFAVILLSIGLIVIGASNGKFPGWIAIACGALAIVSAVR